MGEVVRQTMSSQDDGGSLMRDAYSTEVDLIPDQKTKTLTVRLHPLANTSSDEALKHLCAEINATETRFPGTEPRLTKELVFAAGPRYQGIWPDEPRALWRCVGRCGAPPFTDVTRPGPPHRGRSA